jgi:glycosyltransferase involved in cell wall biosynthesis
MKCSVLLPVYNAGEWLRGAVDSILGQDEPDFEFLIIEDCSTDGSADVVKSLAAQDERIRPIFHQRNEGLAATLNEGLREARSEFVARMDQDDVALPNRLSTQIRFLSTRPQVAVAGSFVYHMGRTPGWDRLVRLPVEHAEIAATLPKHNCLYHPSVMLRRSAILKLDGYRPEFRNSEDYDLWLRASLDYQLANIPVPLLRYRFSCNGMTLGKKWEQALYAQMAIVSHLHPEWSIDQVREQATLELNRLGKDTFLLAVASGTLEELLSLGQGQDARRVWWRFFRQLDLHSKLPALASAWEVYCRRKAFRRSSESLPSQGL